MMIKMMMMLSYIDLTPKQIYRKHENEKKRQYAESRPRHKYHVKSPKYLSGNCQKMSKYPKKLSKYLEKSSKHLEISRIFVSKISRF